jgi:hypothetical protein
MKVWGWKDQYTPLCNSKLPRGCFKLIAEKVDTFPDGESIEREHTLRFWWPLIWLHHKLRRGNDTSGPLA